MKKQLLWVAATLLTSASAGAGVFFTEDFATQEQFSAWTVFDTNQDGSTWEYDSTGDPYKVSYRYNSNNNGDDWLIYPKIDLPAGQYLCKFETKGSSYGETLEVWVGGNDAKAYPMTKQFDQTIPYADVQKAFLFQVEENGGTMLGFHATSPANGYRLYLGKITIEECANPMDIALTAIKSPLSGENLSSEDVTVTVKNEGPSDITSFTLSYTLTKDEESIEVTEEVTPATPLAPGSEMDYTFKAKADMSIPRQAYNLSVTATIDSDINTDNNTLKAEIRHLAAATVPYSMGFEPEEDTSSIAILNCNNDEGDWSINIDGWFSSFSRTGMGSMCYNYDSNNAADDWFFLDPLALESGTYCLKFWYSATANNHPERLRVCYGTAPTPEAMTNVLCEHNPVTNVHYEESISFIEIPTSGKYYIGFYAFSDANENWLCIDDVTLDKIDPTVGDLQLISIREPFEYRRAPHADAVKADVRNVGMVDVTADLTVAIDGNEVKRENVTIPAMKSQTITLENALGELSEGAHTIKVSLDYTQDSDPSNNTLEQNLIMLPEASALWDFENVAADPTDDRIYSVPSELTYRKEDYNNLHPDSGAEFDPEHGFGIFSLQHYALGSKALACCTWFESSGSADRWVVLPQMEVTGANAWFAMDALSFNPGYPESYRVKVSDGRDHWSDYSTKLSIDGESAEYKTRGISLSEYAGKKIYIAVNVATYGGEALVLDNMGVYGDIHNVGSGINQTEDAEDAIRFDGQYLKVATSDTVAIEIFNTNGMKVAESYESTLHVGALPAGIYVAKATTSKGVYSLKFTR